MSVAPPPVTALPPSAAPSASVAPSASSAPRPAVATTAVVPRVVERKVQLDLTPTMGVKVRVDNGPEQDAPSGTVLKVDGKAHTISLTCAVCTTVQRDIAAGEKDEALAVRVPVKPATLVILGSSGKTYQIVEHPEIPVRFGNNSVQLGRSSERVTVKELDTEKTVSVTLQAGESANVSF
jgi:hypothetical protein